MGQTVADDNNIIFISDEVSGEENCKSLIDGAISRFGRVDILVNNVGIKGASKKIRLCKVNGRPSYYGKMQTTQAIV
jgi:NAD(P)-dependent dehydrogenase (short-subunit alcohol dehydrogenase family)